MIFNITAPPGRAAMTASLTPKSGVTYTDGLAGLDAATVSLAAQAISGNAEITGTTAAVYVDHNDMHRKISVGDQVTLALGSVEYAFDIIGFNHDTLTNSAAYGAVTATGKAGMTLQMHDLLPDKYTMNIENTNVGGWTSCNMRTTTLPTLESSLSAEWQSIIRAVDKISSAGNKSASLETTSDRCFLLAEIEIHGSITCSFAGEGTQYAYYAAGNSKVKSIAAGARPWSLRSPYNASTLGWCQVSTAGAADSTGGSANRWDAFAFCV